MTILFTLNISVRSLTNAALLVKLQRNRFRIIFRSPLTLD